MNDQKPFRHVITLIVVLLIVSGCNSAPASPTLVPPTTVLTSPTLLPPTTLSAPLPTAAPSATLTAEPVALWEDVTKTTIGVTAEWTNKVELADINGDGRVDILFANGGDYETSGMPVVAAYSLIRVLKTCSNR